MAIEIAPDAVTRHFVTYSGVKLPFKLVNELGEGETDNRNTFFRGYFDADGRLAGFDKVVYGEIELTHRYIYHPNGTLSEAEIIDADEDDPVWMRFDDTGAPLAD